MTQINETYDELWREEQEPRVDLAPKLDLQSRVGQALGWLIVLAILILVGLALILLSL